MKLRFDFFKLGCSVVVAYLLTPLQAGIEFKKNLRVRFGQYGGLKLEYF